MISMILQNGNTQYGVCDFVVDNVKEAEDGVLNVLTKNNMLGENSL